MAHSEKDTNGEGRRRRPISDEPREATETDAGSGQGTVTGPPKGETQNRPILDGSTMSDEQEKEVEDPRKGMTDPALIRDIEHGKKTINPYG